LDFAKYSLSKLFKNLLLCHSKLNSIFKLGVNDDKAIKQLKKVERKINRLKKENKTNLKPFEYKEELSYSEEYEEVEYNYEDAGKGGNLSNPLENIHDDIFYQSREKDNSFVTIPEETVELSVSEKIKILNRDPSNGGNKSHVPKRKDPPKRMESAKIQKQPQPQAQAPIENNQDDLNNLLEKYVNKKKKKKVSRTKKKRNKDDIQDEKIDNDTKEQLIHYVKGELKTSGFRIIPGNTALIRKFQKEVDVLGAKIIQVEELLDVILIVPIKICNLKGSLIVGEEKVEYIPLLKKLRNNKSLNEVFITSNINALGHIQEAIFQDLAGAGNLFHFFKKYLRVKMKVEKTMTNKKLFFHARQLQYKVLIDPILVCQNEAGFLEKLSVIFPYQKNKNLHIIEASKLADLMDFLEKKYFYIEINSNKKSSVNKYFEAIDKFTNDIRLYSFPFLLFGFSFLLLLVFQVYSVLNIFIGLGYSAVFFYSLLVGYLSLSYFKKKNEVIEEFNTPYYKQSILLDDADLIAISEEVSDDDFMIQFGYECFGKDYSFDILGLLERKKISNLRAKKHKTKREIVPVKKAEKLYVFENNSVKEMSIKDKLTGRYSSFLED